MSFKFKRDISTTLAPALDQVDVGELVLNVQTGTLYTKKRDSEGNESIVKFISVPLSSSGDGSCSNMLPVISFADVTNFCCNGSVLVATINNLMANSIYKYSVQDLTSNSTVIFSQSSGDITPLGRSTRQVPISININTNQPNALIKFSVLDNNNNLQSEAIVAICCKNCAAT
jgi:hypothetical protein